MDLPIVKRNRQSEPFLLGIMTAFSINLYDRHEIAIRLLWNANSDAYPIR